MRKLWWVLVTVASLVALVSLVSGQPAGHGFTLDAPSVRGFPAGEVYLAGGGAYDPESGAVRAGGVFGCAQDVTQGPLAGCRAGEGVRWRAMRTVPSTAFKCRGGMGEPPKIALSGERVAVLEAEFYRAADGGRPSFLATVIVSADDLAPDQPGLQNVWVQGVGAGEARVRFH